MRRSSFCIKIVRNGEIIMPMDKSGSAQSVGKNYKTEVAAGKPKKQALAIALSEQRTHAKGKVKSKLEAAYAKHMAK